MKPKRIKKRHTIAAVVTIALTLYGVHYCMQAKPSPLDVSQGQLVGWLFQLFIGDEDRVDGVETPLAVAVGNENMYYLGRRTAAGGEWKTGNVSPTENPQLNAIVWSGRHFVAVGGPQGMSEIIGGGYLRPVGTVLANECLIYFSANGNDWTRATFPVCTNPLLDVAYGNGRLVAVGDYDTGMEATYALVSSDHGRTWNRFPSAGYSAYHKIVFDGNYFIAVDEDAFPTVYRSADGETWETAPVAHPFGGFTAHVVSALYVMPGSSQVILAGSDGSLPTPVNSARSLYSTNAMTSVSENSTAVFGGSTVQVPLVLLAGGSRLVALGADCKMDYTDQPAGLAWSGTLHSIAGCESGVTIRDAAYGAGFYIAVGVDSGGQGTVSLSQTGLPDDWKGEILSSHPINAIVVGNVK